MANNPAVMYSITEIEIINDLFAQKNGPEEESF